MEYKVTHEIINLNQLNTNAPFQRSELKNHPIHKDGYDEHLEGEIIAVEIDGTLYVGDGKQRTTIKRSLIKNGELNASTPNRPEGWSFNSIRVAISWGHTWESAALLFAKVNQGRKNLTPYDKFKAACAAGDYVANAVKAIATSKGYPPKAAGSKECLTAVVDAQRVVKLYGPEMLGRVLDIWHELYPGQKPWARFIEAAPMVLSTSEPKYRKLLDKYGDDYLVQKLLRNSGVTHHNLQANIFSRVGHAKDSAGTYVEGIKLILGS